MLNLINSYRANRNWIKAHALMGSQFQSLALEAIRKAIKIEPDRKQIPKYLELQGNIESSIGKKDLALQSFRRAIEIIRNNLEYFNTPETKDLEKRIYRALEELNNKAETYQTSGADGV